MVFTNVATTAKAFPANLLYRMLKYFIKMLVTKNVEMQQTYVKKNEIKHVVITPVSLEKTVSWMSVL